MPGDFSDDAALVDARRAGDEAAFAWCSTGTTRGRADVRT
jgi:hypothetical protein